MINSNGTEGPNGNGLGFSRLTQKEGQPTPGAGGMPPAVAPKRKRRSVESKLNFNEIIKMLYRGRWIILGTFILFFAYTVYDTYNKPFIYAASTRLLVEKSVASEKELGPMFQNRDDHSIANQIQFFKSHVVAEHVASLIHKYVRGDRGEMDSLFTEYFGNSAAVPPDPNQLSLIRIEDNPKLDHIEGIADLGTIKNRVQMAVNIMPEPNNDYLGVTAEAFTPLDAALIVNTYVVVFAKDNLARMRQNNIALKEFLSTQKSRSYDTLHKIESQLQENLKDGFSFNIEGRGNELLKQYEEYSTRREGIGISLQKRKKIISDLTSNLDSATLTLTTDLVQEPYIQGLQSAIASGQLEITLLKSQNVIMNPRTKKYVIDEIRAKEEQNAQLQEQLKERASYLIKSQKVFVSNINEEGEQQQQSINSPTQAILRLREAILNNQLAIGQDTIVAAGLDSLMALRREELNRIPGLMGRVGQLNRQKESAERIYTQLEGKYMDAWMSEQSVFGNIKVEDPAGLNAAPIRPNRQANIFTGSLIGLAIGIGIVVLLSMMDSTIRSPEELESHGLNVLATIPIISQMPTLEGAGEAAVAAGGQGMPKFTPHRVSHLDPRSSIAESYRSFRTALQFAGFDHPIQTLAVSSSAPQEGKSTTSANLGIVMSQMGKRTLLVDSDLRRPVLHSVFGMQREPGLTNVLFDRSTLNEAIRATDVPNLFVLPCGIIPPNPAELLGSEKMHRLIDTLKEQFDFIIFDTPPVVAVTDALLLGMQTDAMVLIARADVSKADGVLRAVDAVERSSIRFLGVVLNNFNVANAYGAYYRYYQYYHYYSNEGPQKSGFMQKVNGMIAKFQKPKMDAKATNGSSANGAAHDSRKHIVTKRKSREEEV